MSYELEILSAFVLGVLFPFVLGLGFKVVRSISWPTRAAPKIEAQSQRLDLFERRIFQRIEALEARQR